MFLDAIISISRITGLKKAKVCEKKEGWKSTMKQNKSSGVFFLSFDPLLQLCPQLLLTSMLFSVTQVVYNGKELNHPFGISHYRNSIFWTEYMNASIFQLDLLSGEVTLLRSERPPLFGLRVFDAQSQQGKQF